MRIETIEKGIKYTLFVPPCDLQEVAEKCGLEVFEAATDKTQEEETMIALLKLERRNFLQEECFTKMEQENLICSACGKECGMIHDLGVCSYCCVPIKDL